MTATRMPAKKSDQLMYGFEHVEGGVGRLRMDMPHDVYQRALSSTKLKKISEALAKDALIHVVREGRNTRVQVNEDAIGAIPKLSLADNRPSGKRSAALGRTIALVNGLDLSAHLLKKPDPRLSARFSLKGGIGYNTLMSVSWPHRQQAPSSQLAAIAIISMVSAGERIGYGKPARLSSKIDAIIDHTSEEMTFILDKREDVAIGTSYARHAPDSEQATLVGHNVNKREHQYLGLVGAVAVAQFADGHLA